MDLHNPFEVILHYLLIRGVVGLGHQDEVLMVSTLVCMITHWIGLMMSHDVRLSGSHNFTKLLYYIISQSWKNTKFMLKLVVTMTYVWDHKVIIYSL